MFEDIGRKIQIFAKVYFFVVAIGSVIAGIAVAYSADDDFLLTVGLILLFGGPLMTWIFSWILYAYGELVEDVHDIKKRAPIVHSSPTGEMSTPISREPSSYNGGSTPQKSTRSTHSSETFLLKKWSEGQARYGTNEGRCEICGQNHKELLFVEFEDFFGKAHREICYDCFSRKECTVIGGKKP